MDNYDLVIRAVLAAAVVLLVGVAPVLGIRAWRNDPALLDMRFDITEAARDASRTYRTWLTLTTPVVVWFIGVALLFGADTGETSEPEKDINPDQIQRNPPAANH